MIAGCSNGGHDRRRRYVGVLRGFVSSYSQELVAGTRQRFLAESRPRQRGLETLRTFVTGWPPNCGGPGMPQRHDQFALTIRAIAHDRRKLVGEDPGNAGRLPVLSWAMRNRARMAACPLVPEYRLHM